MITRNAIVISCPGQGDNYLRGAVKDLENMFNYLTSPRGGAWKKNEIYCLENPSWRETKILLDQCTANYQFIYFAGHGCSDENQKRYLTFKDQNIQDIKLLTHNQKQLIVIDACRTYYPTISGIPPAEDVYSYFTGETDARKVFDNCIIKSPNGKIIIHATQNNSEASEERYGRGGAFTLSLLHTAINFKTGKDLSPVLITELMFTIKQTLLSQGYSQTPDIPFITGALNIPFVIETDQIIVEQPKEKAPVYSPEKNPVPSGLVLLSIFLLAIIFSGQKN